MHGDSIHTFHTDADAKQIFSQKMIVKIGQDAFGVQMKENFVKCGISEEYILVTHEAASGVAPIAVDSHGYVLLALSPPPTALYLTSSREA